MNDMRALTKIILGTLGIFLLIQMIPLFTNVMAMAFGASSQTLSGYYVFSFLGVILLWAFLILSVFLFKRDRAVRWITKDIPAQTEPAAATNWIYFAYRLVCFIVGLLLCYRFLMAVPNVVVRIPYYLRGAQESGFSILLQSFGVLLLLPAGIYLLCGAPHFVRWQVSKTLELCKEYEHLEKQENQQS
jgi:hypothetical protein